MHDDVVYWVEALYRSFPTCYGDERNFPKVRQASQGADFHLGIPKVSHHRPCEFPRCDVTVLSSAAPAGYVPALPPLCPLIPIDAICPPARFTCGSSRGCTIFCSHQWHLRIRNVGDPDAAAPTGLVPSMYGLASPNPEV